MNVEKGVQAIPECKKGEVIGRAGVFIAEIDDEGIVRHVSPGASDWEQINFPSQFLLHELRKAEDYTKKANANNYTLIKEIPASRTTNENGVVVLIPRTLIFAAIVPRDN